MVALVALALPAAAPANGDPASDFLLSQDVFFPFERKLSAPVKQDLVAAIERANEAGYPTKVAIINSRSDLGLVPGMFGKPQDYAEFLGSEIRFQFLGHLVVAMPQGLGLSYQGGKPDPQRSTVAKIPVPDGADGTGTASIRAIDRLAAAGASDSGGGFPMEIVAGLAATLLVLAGIAAVVVLARRRQQPEDDLDEPPSAPAA